MRGCARSGTGFARLTGYDSSVITRALPLLLLGVLSACNSTANTVTSSASAIAAQATPTATRILVTPMLATVDVTPHFVLGQNDLGDPIETLNVDISSNIPVTFEADTRLFINTLYHEEASCGSDPVHTCIVS